MSAVVIGVMASHTTLMNTQWDAVDHLDRAHEFRNGLWEARNALTHANVDVAIIVGPNHFRVFCPDLILCFLIHLIVARAIPQRTPLVTIMIE